jgi:microcystin-dependent protein
MARPRTTPGQPGSGRLSESEVRLVARLLSDPTYFPVEFRSWLKSFLESADIFAERKAGGAVVVKTNLPAGILLPIASLTWPSDCLGCDGSVQSRTTYAKLFEVIGTSWGAGDGSTTFNLPDLRDRALFCVGGRVGLAQTDGRALGQRGGPSHFHALDGVSVSVSVSSAGDHQHPGVGDHQHQPVFANFARMNYSTFPEGNQPTTRYAVTEGDPYTGPAGGHQHGIAGSHAHSASADLQGSTSGGFDQDEPSWAGVAFVITTGGVAVTG